MIITLPACVGSGIIFCRLRFPDWSEVCRGYSAVLYGRRGEYVNGRDYLRTDNGVGITFSGYGFRVDYEHVFRQH